MDTKLPAMCNFGGLSKQAKHLLDSESFYSEFSRTTAVGLSMSHFSSPKKTPPTGRLAGGMIGTSNEHGCDAGIQICTISAIQVWPIVPGIQIIPYPHDMVAFLIVICGRLSGYV